jgi:RNA polymerase sigma-70 factor (ECF subfamily)
MDLDQKADIILRILEGEREVYALLVEEYKTPIFNLAYRVTGSYEDAGDLTQDTFIRAYTNLRKFDADRPFFTWLYTIALNVIRNHLRKKALFGRAGSESEFERLNGAGNPETGLLKDERSKRLAACLKNLPIDQREAIILRYYQGISFNEIAEILGLSQSAVKMRVSRGLVKLKRVMGD